MNRRKSSWEWNSTTQTRESMLRAAREVFGEHGFADASISDVVERAGSSVGSLYHHFGGKAELFLALWEEHQSALERAAESSVADVRKGGATEPVDHFVAGARAYLESAWERRDLTLKFMDGDAPPGFELMRRTRGREWLRQNSALLCGGGDTIPERLTAAILTAAIGAAGREVAACETKAQADEVIKAAVALIRRLAPLEVLSSVIEAPSSA
ncbi:TetR/AcrR family transcriptional regulator [Streptomyces carpinensis]|uniref:TetR/AcrR family transcriptional regulator n=1 Tax=Streptomyces carpinensis TaxID=66369 RepID=A0ABV1W405_9ACTN|nr:TetR/AcrR family transcriptional regulator [Streptomyces carpinensis]